MTVVLKTNIFLDKLLRSSLKYLGHVLGTCVIVLWQFAQKVSNFNWLAELS